MHLDNGDAWGPLWLQNIADTIELKRTKGDLAFMWALRAFAAACLAAVVMMGADWFAAHPMATDLTPMVAAAAFAIVGLLAFVVALYRNQPAVETY